ncbi:GtrA family protein [Paracoccus aminophilus]|uniref:GtrA/DPMS transmembrane domain-containing protein n=1 Tax=Paracoccus aminophilus JCM 7686 TaxID=1367847 RepID=S5YI74_PARAH|nr:GtrA family protein [Paracoccus aminophilus]AGT11178.1 hypothetical protein JCM7686_pAMI5p112 [Paracoccus aminophilus JCM 7686]
MTASRSAEVVTFLLVGLSSTAVYFSLLWALQGLTPRVAVLAAICYLASMIWNFVLQRSLTFRHRSPSRGAPYRFGLMHGVALGLNSLTMWALVERAGLPLYAAQIGVTTLIAALIYLASSRWVFATP